MCEYIQFSTDHCDLVRIATIQIDCENVKDKKRTWIAVLDGDTQDADLPGGGV